MSDFNSTSAPHGQFYVGDVPPNFGRAWNPAPYAVAPLAHDYSDVLDRIADALEELVLQASLKKDPLDDFEWMGTPPTATRSQWSEVNFQESDHDNPCITRGGE